MLTAKQRAFADEYLTDANATQAAIRAGYSQRTAYSQGQRLLKNVEVKARIEEQQAEIRERNAVTVDSITQIHLDAIEIAREQKAPNVMTTAANNLAKLHGLITDKSKVDAKVEGSHDDWVRKVLYVAPDGTYAGGREIHGKGGRGEKTNEGRPH